MINKDELLQVVDENNNLLDPRPRHEVHDQGLWHRVSIVWIYNSQKQLLCQKRSLLKDSAPGKWEPFFGGHLQPGIQYLDGAKREVGEELGIDVNEKDLILWKIFKKDKGHEFLGVFTYSWDGRSEDLKFEKEEIDQLKWVSINEIENIVLKEKNPNWSCVGYENDLLPYIRSMFK